jgi:hypothetical protein
MIIRSTKAPAVGLRCRSGIGSKINAEPNRCDPVKSQFLEVVLDLLPRTIRSLMLAPWVPPQRRGGDTPDAGQKTISYWQASQASPFFIASIEQAVFSSAV